MTDKNEALTETDDELIPVEEAPPVEETDDAADDTDDDDDDASDERLGDDEEEHEDEVSVNRKRRQKRREVQKAAKERAQRELEYLRRKVTELEQRQGGVEGHVAQTQLQTLEQQLARAKQEAMMAEQVFVKATQAGNNADAQQALQIRDQARAAQQQLEAAKQQFEQARSAPRVDPQVANYAQQWVKANPWYDPQGRDRDSALAKAIDNEVAADGYDPKSREYWEELTRRLSDQFGSSTTPSAEAPKSKRKTPPPTGSTREHAPASTKREIYVTPERKQAMIDAGVWDDPTARQRYLKAYRDYDTRSAR